MAKILKAASVLICVCILAVSLAGCGGDTVDPNTSGMKTTYTITLKSGDGLPLTDLRVLVYEDSTQSELVCVGKTDAEGSLSFTDVSRDSYVAVLDAVPTGYDAAESYPLTGENTEITLAKRAMTDQDMDDLTYALGDAMLDFTVTDCEGGEHTLSELLKEKKAVVLNFWYLNCQPCKMEFPYLQEAFEEYSGDVALLAMNPVDGTDESVRAFRDQNELTFPMASCDARWQNMMKVTAYPTTVIIDRYGSICLIHKGMFTDSVDLMKALNYFTGDHYEQKFFTSIAEIPSGS